MPEFNIRRASAVDRRAIRELIRKARINRLGLHWSRFTLAVNHVGEIIGCGQLKRHRDGSVELASLAVSKRWRRMGVGRAIIESLIDSHKGRLWLTCQSKLIPLYERFGFESADGELHTSRHYRRIYRFLSLIHRYIFRKDFIAIMCKRKS